MTTAKQKTTDPQSALSEAFVAAWSEIQTVAHDASNPHFRNEYTSYDRIMQVIRPIMSKHGLAIIQAPFVVEDTNKAGINTSVMHNLGGTMDLGCIAVPSKKQDDPQAFGSSMTYAKRYSLCASLGIPTGEDDDGNLGASAPVKQAEPQTPKQQAAAAIKAWCGMDGDDLIRAMGDVVRVSGTKEPTELIEYVKSHMSDDFITHIKNNTNQEQEANA